MWHKEYQDYPIDTPLVHYTVEPGHGIKGCEMHELNGWGDTIHCSPVPKSGLFRRWIIFLFGKGRRHTSRIEDEGLEKKG